MNLLTFVVLCICSLGIVLSAHAPKSARCSVLVANIKTEWREFLDMTMEYRMVVHHEIRRLETSVAPERHISKMEEHIEFIKEQLDRIKNSQAHYQKLMQELEPVIAAAAKASTATGGESPAAGAQKPLPESSSHPGCKQSSKPLQPEIVLEGNMIKMNSIYGYPLIGFYCEDNENRGVLKISVDSHHTQRMCTTKNVVVKRKAIDSFNELVRDRKIKLKRINYRNTEHLPVLVYFEDPEYCDIIRNWFRGLQEDWKA